MESREQRSPNIGRQTGLDDRDSNDDGVRTPVRERTGTSDSVFFPTIESPPMPTTPPRPSKIVPAYSSPSPPSRLVPKSPLHQQSSEVEMQPLPSSFPTGPSSPPSLRDNRKRVRPRVETPVQLRQPFSAALTKLKTISASVSAFAVPRGGLYREVRSEEESADQLSPPAPVGGSLDKGDEDRQSGGNVDAAKVRDVRTLGTGFLPSLPSSSEHDPAGPEEEDGGGALKSLTSIRFVPGPRILSDDDDSDDSSVDPIMEVMDRIEDEIDGHTYDDLIPLQVRLALEENVFGWSHLMSDIAGHIVYTGLAYALTYWIITFLFLQKVGHAGDCGGPLSCWFASVMRWFREHLGWSNQDTLSGGDDSESSKNDGTKGDLSSNDGTDIYVPLLGISYETFSFLRFLLSTMSAISAFRTVRRRRRVWLRSSYGTTEYHNDSTRRQSSLEEADRSTLLGRIRLNLGKRKDAFYARRVHKTLNKAKNRFEKRHRHRVRLIKSKMQFGPSIATAASSVAAHHHHRVRVLAGSGHVIKSPEELKRRSSLRRNVSDSSSATARTSHGSSSGIHPKIIAPFPLEEQDYPHPHDQSYTYHTLPTEAMQSVAHDQIPFTPGAIHNIPYAHGGFFGAAPFMLANPYWIDILRHLMPDVYVEISRRAVYAPAPKLIHWAENNPVVAAYGTAHELEYNGKVSTLEWDVFLDPHLVKRVEIVLHERERFLRSCSGSDGTFMFDNNVSLKASSLSPQNMTTPSERTILQYYNAEIARRTNLLVERMLIAHGNLTQLVLEQTGYRKRYNFSRVKRTRRTLGGGIFARQWLSVYAEALRIGMGVCDELDDEMQSHHFHSHVDSLSTRGNLMGVEGEEVKPVEEVESPGHSSGTEFLGQSDSDASSEFLDVSNDESDTDMQDVLLVSDAESGDTMLEDTAGVQSSGCESFERQPSLRHNSFSSPSRAAHANCLHERPESVADGSAKPSPFVDGDHTLRPRLLTPSGVTRISRRLINGREGCDGRSGNHQTPKRKCPSRKRRRGSFNRPLKNQTSLHALAHSTCPNTSMSQSIALLKSIMDCRAPLGLVLDLKSRHVPKQIWGLVVDALRDAGARVEGIGTFMIEEIRDVSYYCASPVREILFFHSAGDVQKACHEGRVRRGDTVFFNAGSLLWDRPASGCMSELVWRRCWGKFDAEETKRRYCFMPYARVVQPQCQESELEELSEETASEGISPTSTFETDDDAFSEDGKLPAATRMPDGGGVSSNDHKSLRVGGVDSQGWTTGSTIQHYKNAYNISIGLYCQEFAIDEAAVDLLVRHVNDNPHVYDLGLAWGGVNGVTVRGIQPGRFTNTEGFWNQRYGGWSWESDLYPPVEEDLDDAE